MHVMALPGVASLPPMGCGLMRVWQELADLGLLFGQLVMYAGGGVGQGCAQAPGLLLPLLLQWEG